MRQIRQGFVLIACLLFIPSGIWAQSVRVAQEWQRAPVPTGLERFFLERVLYQMERALHGTDMHPRFDSMDNLIIASYNFDGPPDVAIACGIDEPTFIISGRRTGEYFGVRPLFFQALTPERLRPWMGHPLTVVTVSGRKYPATFAIPSTHLHRGRRDDWWNDLREKDLYLDAGLPEENEIDLLDRVVRRRYFDTLPGDYWVGYDLGRRMVCYALFELVLHAGNKGISGKVHFVFATQSRFGHRGLQAYLTQVKPKAFVYLSVDDKQSRIHVLSNGVKIPKPSPILERIMGSGVEVGQPDQMLSALGRMTYAVDPVRKILTENPVFVVILPVRRPVGDTEVVRVAPNQPDSLEQFIGRLKSWFE